MKIYSKKNVYDAALERINFLFDEFEHIVVCISGGKDSTVILNLSLQVARERGRLPLSVMWLDQEAEWQGTVDYVTTIMESPEVKPYWLQIPFVITNNASSYERYNHCWNEEDREKWIHPQHPLSIKVNKYGTERFHEMFARFLAVEFPKQKACYIGGVRTEESPKRLVALTSKETYKGITWAKCLSKQYEQYTFYPIYDWSYTDVWKCIHDNGWPYNEVYDKMYQIGMNIGQMRISNVHHETSIQDLEIMQDIEPDTWERVARRIAGANTINHIKTASFRCPEELPFMFKSWEEYAMYLFDVLIQEQQHKDALAHRIKKMSEIYTDTAINERMWREVINTILSADWDLTKLTNFETRHDIFTYKVVKKGKVKHNLLHHAANNKFITPEMMQSLIDREKKRKNDEHSDNH